MIRSFLAGLSLAFVSTLALAQGDPPAVFFGGHPPAVSSTVPGPLVLLCYDAYCLQESGAWREPAWSAEHLTAAQLPPRGADRKNPFHPEPRLSPDQRAELADYAACSKTHDRGHATPVGDFTAKAQRDQTFTLANMMAQTKTDNEQVWNHIETGLRAQVKTEGEAWVVTGPAVPADPQHLCGRVAEPVAIWKAVYFPKSGVIGAYWSPNDSSNSETTITVAELIRRLGIDPFPGLPDAKKAEAHDLPKPVAAGG